jgi:hypothetical protein
MKLRDNSRPGARFSSTSKPAVIVEFLDGLEVKPE